MKIVACEQRTPEWRKVRIGKLTGSRVGEAFATRRDGKEAAGRRNVRIELVLERLTGVSQENGFTSFDMERGAQLEDEARAAYEAETGLFLETVGFVEHDDLAAGCSPDGVLLNYATETPRALVEIKAPKAATHLDYLREGLPREYFLQIIHALWLTGAEWAEFVSYHPQFPPTLRLKRTHIRAADVDLVAHELNVRTFLSEVEKEVDAVRALMTPEVVA